MAWGCLALVFGVFRRFLKKFENFKIQKVKIGPHTLNIHLKTSKIHLSKFTKKERHTHTHTIYIYIYIHTRIYCFSIYISIYTDKTTLHVIGRLGGGRVQRTATHRHHYHYHHPDPDADLDPGPNLTLGLILTLVPNLARTWPLHSIMSMRCATNFQSS